MFLRTLTLNGFKAFAEKVTFHFEEGICGFVGPNGCGKSNLIDAIMWVIGEQKTSALRGERMEDVIFHGSDHKKISNMAEVEIVLNNDPKTLPINYSEVSICRRLYRSGESEYFINKNPSRLKDIQNLLLNTGIGLTSYSVIAQGKIDQILNQNPLEKRLLFEEAAAISDFKGKRREYERKVKDIEGNLVRIRDLVRELSAQKSQLHKQAEKCGVYFDLQQQLKSLQLQDIKVKLHKVALQKTQLQQKQKRIKEANLERKQEQLRKVEAAITQSQKSLDGVDGDAKVLERQKVSLDEKIIAIKNNQNLLGERYKEIINQMQFQKEDIAKIVRESSDQKQAVLELEKGIQKTVADEANSQRALKSLKKEWDVLREKAKENSFDTSESKRKLKQYKQELQSLSKEHHVVVEDLVKEIDQVKGQIQKSQSDNQAAITKARECIASLEESAKNFAQLSSLDSGESIQRLSKGQLADAYRRLVKAGLRLKGLVAENATWLEALLKHQDPFYDLIFSTEGTYAKKEHIDQKITYLNSQVIQEEKAIEGLNEAYLQLQQAQQASQKSMSTLEAQLSATANNLELSRRHLEEKKTNLSRSEDRNKAIQNELQRIKALSESVQSQQQEATETLLSLTKEHQETTHLLNEHLKQTAEQTLALNTFKAERQQLTEDILGMQRQYDDLGLQIQLLDRDSNHIREHAHEAFSETIDENDNEVNLADHPSIKSRLNEAKQHLKQLGAVNLLAKDEHDQISGRLEKTLQHKEDIERSMEDLEGFLNQLDQQASEQFLNTFEAINQNFNDVFKRLFGGGQAKLRLTDSEQPLECGVEISIQPPGKKFQNINLFSGGEKSLIAIALMMSIFQIKPSPLCLLDEVDAALDKENIARLSNLLSEFKDKTQILIISHNEKTFSIINYLYGITMNDGVSKAFSISFDELDQRRQTV